MPEFICQECHEEYNPLITEDDCGLCVDCTKRLLEEMPLRRALD